jgi:hypothetical protein
MEPHTDLIESVAALPALLRSKYSVTYLRQHSSTSQPFGFSLHGSTS